MALDDIKRVLAAEASLADVAAAHTRALDGQIRTLRLQRAVLGTVARSTDPRELERMTDLATADRRANAAASSRTTSTQRSKPRRNPDVGQP